MQLKDIYSPQFYNRFADVLQQTVTRFDKSLFVSLIFDTTWQQRELKDRMKHTTHVLHRFLPSDFEAAATVIERTIELLQKNGFNESSIEFMFFPDYIERYGIEHFDTSVRLIERVTQFTSCEFAVRPFIIKYGNRMMQQMLQWSLHPNHHVRRLASEGSRPRLPWAIALPEFKKNPLSVLPILENLKTDVSEYVRRSVANNINDIAKDNPQTVLTLIRQWKNISPETDAIVRHGCRTLLKQANADVLEYFNLQNNAQIVISDVVVDTPTVKIGDSLHFSFKLRNANKQPQVVRLEYAIYYKRQHGVWSKKVFKISEKQYQVNEQAHIKRKQSFRLITTRVFYAGTQYISIIANGKEYDKQAFELMN